MSNTKNLKISKICQKGMWKKLNNYKSRNHYVIIDNKVELSDELNNFLKL